MFKLVGLINMSPNAILCRIKKVLIAYNTIWSCANGLYNLFCTIVVHFLTASLTRQIQTKCHHLHNYIELDHTIMCIVCMTIRIPWATISISQSPRKACLVGTASYYIWILKAQPLLWTVFGHLNVSFHSFAERVSRVSSIYSARHVW